MAGRSNGRNRSGIHHTLITGPGFSEVERKEKGPGTVGLVADDGSNGAALWVWLQTMGGTGAGSHRIVGRRWQQPGGTGFGLQTVDSDRALPGGNALQIVAARKPMPPLRQIAPGEQLLRYAGQHRTAGQIPSPYTRLWLISILEVILNPWCVLLKVYSLSSIYSQTIPKIPPFHLDGIFQNAYQLTI